ESMRWIAEAAGLDIHGFAGMARVGALVGLWTHVTRVWEQDENVDMGNTMAALEQALDQGVKWGLLSSGGILRAVMS
ncbi:MAG: TetR family transcriptional regulator, partial [Acetobacter sp.]|nr:TetR family transcriptional regulator [Acetobacter sp.]